MTPNGIQGGQGRDGDDIRASALAIVCTLCACLLFWLVILLFSGAFS